MARSFKDALLKAGAIKQEDTPEARQAKERLERQQREKDDLAKRMADTNPLPQWEAPASGRIVDSRVEMTSDALVTCSDCGERFDPTAAEHMAFGRADQCGRCARREGP